MVGIVRKLGQSKIRVGHAGTLDPLATGVLLVCLGPATRLIQYIHRHSKSYDAEFLLGRSSNTDDVFGEVTEMPNPPVLDAKRLSAQLSEFIGEIQQVPPAFSAVKVNGQRAYELARKGKDVQLTAKTVTIKKLELLAFEYPKFQLRIECGSGTYIRSLGRDIAKQLGSSAVMSKLNRTDVAGFSITESHEIDVLTPDNLVSSLDPVLRIVEDLPRIVISQKKIIELTNGCFVGSEEIDLCNQLSLEDQAAVDQADEIAAICEAGELVAVLKRFDKNNFRPGINFAHYWAAQNNTTP